MRNTEKIAVLTFPELRKILSYEIEGYPRSMAFSNDGKRLCIASDAGRNVHNRKVAAGLEGAEIHLFDCNRWNLVNRFTCTVGGYISRVAMPSADCILAAQAGGLVVYDTHGEELASRNKFYFYSEVEDMLLSPNKDWTALAYFTGRVSVIDVSQLPQPLGKPYVLRYAGVEYTCLSCSRNGRWLFVGGNEYVPPEQDEITRGTVHVYDLSTKKLHARWLLTTPACKN